MFRIKPPIFIFLLGLILGLIYIWLLFPQRLYGHEYEDIARFIAQGKGYIGPGFFKYSIRPTSFLAPLYTYLFAFSLFIFGFSAKSSHLFMYILQAVSFSLTAVLVYLIAKKYFSNRAAVVFTILYFAYLPIYSTILTIWDTSFLILLFSAAAFLYFKFLDSDKILVLIILACVLGLGALLNPVSLVFIPAIILHYLIYGLSAKKIKTTLFLIAIPLLIIMPWAIRNYLVHKALVPVRTGLGLNLYLGNNPNATGTAFLKVNGKVPDKFEVGIIHNFWSIVIYRWQANKATEIQEDKDLTKEFVRYVQNNPLDFTRLFFKKIFYFWWKNPFQKDPLDSFQPGYAIILLLSMSYFFITRFKNPQVNFIYIILFFFTLLYALTGPYFNWKYRFPIEPFIIMFAAVGVVSWLDRFSVKNKYM